MPDSNVACEFYFEDVLQNRKVLFNKTLFSAVNGRVLYILPEELHELPQLSQDVNQIDKHYMKMITFVYAPSLKSLLESLVTLPHWQHVPSTIILDSLSDYCNKDNISNACGIIAFLIDTIKSCGKILKCTCRLCVSAPKELLGEDFCIFLSDVYGNQIL